MTEVVTVNRGTKDPDVFRAIEINDPHVMASSPPAFKLPYPDHLDSMLSQVFAAAIRFQCDAILFSGDIFHLKEPRNNPLWLVTKTIRQLKEIQHEGKLDVLGVAGNHDVKYGSIDPGLKGQPLEVLIEAGAYHLLDRADYLYQLNGHTVRIAGGSYRHGQAQHIRDKKKLGADTLITMGHFWLGAQTGEFFGEALYGFDFFREAESDIICVGHHHEDKGVAEVDGRHYVSQGSMSITGSHGHDLNRRPAACLIEVSKDEKKFTLLRPKMPPINELLDLEKHAEIKQERKEMDDFITNLATAEVKSADPVDILQEVAPSVEVRIRAMEFIQAAELRSNKK
jgi:predicted phosphodiesterase